MQLQLLRVPYAWASPTHSYFDGWPQDQQTVKDRFSINVTEKHTSGLVLSLYSHKQCCPCWYCLKKKNTGTLFLWLNITQTHKWSHETTHQREGRNQQCIFSNGQRSNNNTPSITCASQLTAASFKYTPFDGKILKYKLWNPLRLLTSQSNTRALLSDFFLCFVPYIPAPRLWGSWEIQKKYLRILYCIWSSIHLTCGGPNQLPEVDTSQEEKEKTAKAVTILQ